MNYYHFDFPWKSKKPGLAVLQGPSLAYKYKDKTTSIICCTKLANCVWKPYLQWWRKSLPEPSVPPTEINLIFICIGKIDVRKCVPLHLRAYQNDMYHTRFI